MLKRLLSARCLLVVLAAFTATNSYAQCNDPMPSVLNIANDSVTLSWPAVTNAIGYEYVVQAAALPQPTSGTPTSATTVGVGNLPYAAHKAWVRTDCGTSTLSNWASITFTIVCTNPNTITFTNVNETTADISWTKVADINDYEYKLDQVATAPTTAGTPHTGTSYPASGLTGGTDYYMHVRTNCSNGNYSSWTTRHFVTKFPVGINTAATDAGIRVFPNPVSDVLQVQLPAGAEGQLTLTNISGALLYTQKVSAATWQHSMQQYAPGMYILRYATADNTYYFRVTKQ